MQTVKLALNAMNTRFELVLLGDNPAALRSAGEEALREIARIEELLSAFRATSEIAHVNARAATESVQVSPEVFEFLINARRLWELTDGAFDITIGPLMRCWGFWGARGSRPDSGAITAALGSVGMQHLELNSAHRTVQFGRKGMTIDPGAIGKGYAIDRSVEVLREHGVVSGLLHGGTSTTYGIGSPAGERTWRTAVELPQEMAGRTKEAAPVIQICNESVSVSSPLEKAFSVNGTTYGHVIDPRTGWPVEGAMLTAVVVPTSAEADALSTALLVLGDAGVEQLQRAYPQLRALIVGADGSTRYIGMEAEMVSSK